VDIGYCIKRETQDGRHTEVLRKELPKDKDWIAADGKGRCIEFKIPLEVFGATSDSDLIIRSLEEMLSEDRR
jgi:hypothetical protein